VPRGDVTRNDVIGDRVGPVGQPQKNEGQKGHREQTRHEDSWLPVENHDVSKVECVGPKDENGIRSTSGVLCGIRDFLETKDQTSIASSAAAAAAAGQSISPAERLLASVNDMIERRLHSDDQQRHQRDKNQQMMSEWMIAAAVIDRTCFILFSFCFVIGTAVLFFLAVFAEN